MCAKILILSLLFANSLLANEDDTESNCFAILYTCIRNIVSTDLPSETTSKYDEPIGLTTEERIRIIQQRVGIEYF